MNVEVFSLLRGFMLMKYSIYFVICSTSAGLINSTGVFEILQSHSKCSVLPVLLINHTKIHIYQMQTFNK